MLRGVSIKIVELVARDFDGGTIIDLELKWTLENLDDHNSLTKLVWGALSIHLMHDWQLTGI